jgi:histone deacetylase 6
MSHAFMLWIATSVTKSVKAIVQVMGLQKSPSFPSDIEDARNWYERVCDPVLNSLEKLLISFQCSLVVIPSTHPMTGPVMKPKDIRRHGTIIPIGIVSSTR